MITTNNHSPEDIETARAFATSWNNLPKGSIYNLDQFKEWLEPLREEDMKNKTILELGCGNGSLLIHLPKWMPFYIEGVDLGDSVLSCEYNMKFTCYNNYKITQADLTKFKSDGFDIVYSIGVIHHLKNPEEGFASVLKNTRAGGKFHCWVYAEEGNSVIIKFVEPIRKLASKLPWWITKYMIATPLVIPYYIYANIISRLKYCKNFPLYEYSKWISKREFLFFRHVAFDQLVTPQTTYIPKSVIEEWLSNEDLINQNSTYIICRNGNSWKFGGIRK